jgi:hypothetical protein
LIVFEYWYGVAILCWVDAYPPPVYLLLVIDHLDIGMIHNVCHKVISGELLSILVGISAPVCFVVFVSINV